MRIGLNIRTLLLIALVALNLATSGIILGPAASPTKQGLPASAETSVNPQPGQSSLGNPAAGHSHLQATVDVASLPPAEAASTTALATRLSASAAKYFEFSPARTQSSPIITSPSTPGPSSVTLLTGSEGLSSLSGAGDPPDVVLAAGPSHVVEMVNNVGAVFSKQGVLLRTFDLHSFFQPSFASDPKVLYDATSQRWFASAIQTTAASKVVLAVSATNDPNGIWRDYTLIGVGTCTDQPYFGVSDDKVVVTGNEFSNGCPSTISTIGYLGDLFWILNKLEMLAGLGTIDLATSGPFPTTESVYPVQSLSPTTSEYMVSAGINVTFDSGATSPTSKTVQLFTVTGVPPDNVTVATLAFSTSITRPPPGQEPGGSQLQTDDARVEDAAWNQGILWLTLPDACTPPGDSQQRSCIHLIQIDTTSFTPKQDLEFGIPGQYLFYPAITMDNLGNLGVIYGYSSATNSTCCFPSLAVTGQIVSDPPNTLTPPRTIRQGSLAGGAQRYGDYFGAARDPSDPTIIWVAGEYLGSPSTFVQSFRLKGLTMSTNPAYLSVSPGSTTTSTLTVTSVGGFNGTISLSAAVSPPGPTVSVNPSSVTLSSSGTQSSTVTISTTSTTPPGLYNVTLTANSGGANRFLTIPLRVGPDFTISTSPTTLSFPTGSSASTIVTIRSLNGFAGAVSFSASAWAPGPALSFNSTTLNLTPGGTASAKLTASTNQVAAGGNYAITINSASGSITHLQTITAGVTDFGVGAAPPSLNVGAGTSVGATITLTSITGLAGPVQLSASASPSGPSLGFNPATVSLPARGLGNSTLTISVPAFATVGAVFTITVRGANGALVHSASITVTVVGLVCIADINSLSPCPSSSGWSFNGPATSPPTQLKVGVFVSNSASFNLFEVTVVSDSTKLFPVSVDTSASLLGPSASYLICIRGNGNNCGPQDGFNTVSVAAFTGPGTPAPTTGLLFAITYNVTSLTPTIPISFQTGCSNESVQGTNLCVGLAVGGTFIPETVQTASFSSFAPQQSVSLSASPSTLGPVPANTGSTTIITATSQNGFPVSDTGTVTFTTAQSSGAGTSFNASIVTLTPGGSISVALTITGSGPGIYWVTTFGTYTVTNSTTGFTNTLIATLTVSITVTDFKLSANPTTVSFDAGLTNTSTITVTSLNGFAGPVTFSASSFLNRVSATFNATSVTLTAGGNATTTATFRSSTPGTFTVSIRGTSSNDIRAVAVTAKVADFTISENPTSQTIPSGSERQTLITIGSIGTFSGTVKLVAAPSSKAVLCWFTSLTNTSYVTVPTGGTGTEYPTCTGGAAGIYTVTITGTIGTQSHSVVLKVTITDFSISGPGSVPFPTGTSNTGNVTLTSLFGLSGTINLTITTPTAVSVSCPSSTTLASNSTTTVTCSFSSSTPGQYTVTITGSFKCNNCYYNGKVSHSIAITINVGDFSISLNPTSATIQKGFGSSASSTLTLTSLYSFSGTITLTTQISPRTNNLPSVSLDHSTLTVGANGSATATLTVTANSSTTKTTYTVTVTATSGSIVHTAAFTVTIT